MAFSRRASVAVWAGLFFTCTLPAAVPSANELKPNLAGSMAHPLRYQPEGMDFVIESGGEFFNRPLYGGNTAFRVDAGDRPEFVLYLPGRGGNLRLGLRAGARVRWLHEAARIVARYRPGAMHYEISDPELLGRDGLVRLVGLAPREFEGLIVRVEASRFSGELELVWAYGGVNGQRGRRDGDIGTEDVPISEWFQLRPGYCTDNVYSLDGDSFLLQAKPGRIRGVCPAGSSLRVADARDWEAAKNLFAPAGAAGETIPAQPILVGRAPLATGVPAYLVLQRIPGADDDATELQTYLEVRAGVPDARASSGRQPSSTGVLLERADVPAAFARAEQQRAAVASQVRVTTPDPFINATAGALNIAADAVWDEPQGAVMHGAIAWRSKLLGWRGPYAMDALGWHDRARRHLSYWAERQNLEPIPEKLPPPEEETNLARSRTALHSRGNLSNSHYDMNLVYIDALFRHLMWTGDLAFAREVWPVIERHLEWERRMFRREFGAQKLPLYEAYAAIWASDDLQYHGGGVAYASAYNYWHNLMAGRLARLLGHDPARYENEARLLARAMREVLWMPEVGMFAEFKDLLGNQLLHTSPGLWSFYHVMDAWLPTGDEALAMTRWVDGHIPHLPVQGPGVPDDMEHHVLSTTNWMPYTWSVNNVVMGENIHTALGYWQAGRAEEAFRLTRSALLASMFMGICPGNVGSMNYLDVYRRESQRDFADGCGVLSRALVEGLFGVRPDLLAGRLAFAPGFPEGWASASLAHPDISVDYVRTGRSERYLVSSRLPQPVGLEARLRPRGASARVRVNGRAAKPVLEAGAGPTLVIQGEPGGRWEIEIEWSGPLPAAPAAPAPWPGDAAEDIPGVSHFDWRSPLPDGARLEAVELTAFFNDRVTEIFAPGKYRSPRSPFVSLAIPAQGIGAWAGHVKATAEIDDAGLRGLGGRLELANGVWFATPSERDARNVVFVSQWDNYPGRVELPLAGRARRLFLLMAGSTNHMQSRMDNGEIVVAYADGTRARLPLANPTNWWPIDQDYFIDDYQFRRPGPLPPRLDLKTGRVRLLDPVEFPGQGRVVPGGAATLLAVPLDPNRELSALTLRALSNEVVIGLLAATLERRTD